MKEIQSLNNELIKKVCKLKDKKERYKRQEFIVEGYHLVEEAYKKQFLKTIFTTDNSVKINVESYFVTKDIIKKLSSTMTPQGIIGVCKMKESADIIGNHYLLLDNVSDPGNLGTLIRSSIGFGIDTIILSNDSVDIYNEKVMRSTQGAIFNANILYSDLPSVIKRLKEQQVTIIGTSLQSSVDLKEISNLSKYAIVLGNEAKGVRKDILDLTDVNVKIRISEQLESLNVAVAGSIVMYYLNN